MAVYCSGVVSLGLCIVFLQLISAAGQDVSTCHQATGDYNYSNSPADVVKVPISGAPTRIHHLHNPLNYGYLGDQCVPSLNLTEPGPFSAISKWRIICKAPSNLFVIVLGLDVPEEDYLQVRRRALRGSVEQYQTLSLKKNSILVGYVRGEHSSSPDDMNPFRLAYICADPSAAHLGEQLLGSRAVLDYIQQRPHGIELMASILGDLHTAFRNHIEEVQQILILGNASSLINL